MDRLLRQTRFLIAPVCLAVAGLALVVFVWAGAKAVALTVDLVTGGTWKRDAPVGTLLSILDLFLIGAVLIIVATGLWQIFIGRLDVPRSLSVPDLSALKQRISDVLILVLAIQFAKQFLGGVGGERLLYSGIAVALVAATLVLFTTVQRSHSDDEPDAVPES